MWEAKGTDRANQAQNGGCLYLLSTARATQPAFSATPTKRAKTSSSSPPIRSAARTRRLYDVYDAREGGGFASQNGSKKSPAKAKAESTIDAAAGRQSAGSASFSGHQSPERKVSKRAAQGQAQGAPRRQSPLLCAVRRNEITNAIAETQDDRRAGR